MESHFWNQSWILVFHSSGRHYRIDPVLWERWQILKLFKVLLTKIFVFVLPFKTKSYQDGVDPVANAKMFRSYHRQIIIITIPGKHTNHPGKHEQPSHNPCSAVSICVQITSLWPRSSPKDYCGCSLPEESVEERDSLRMWTIRVRMHRLNHNYDLFPTNLRSTARPKTDV